MPKRKRWLSAKWILDSLGYIEKKPSRPCVKFPYLTDGQCGITANPVLTY